RLGRRRFPAILVLRFLLRRSRGRRRRGGQRRHERVDFVLGRNDRATRGGLLALRWRELGLRRVARALEPIDGTLRGFLRQLFHLRDRPQHERDRADDGAEHDAQQRAENHLAPARVVGRLVHFFRAHGGLFFGRRRGRSRRLAVAAGGSGLRLRGLRL